MFFHNFFFINFFIPHVKKTLTSNIRLVSDTENGAKTRRNGSSLESRKWLRIWQFQGLKG